jgi:hypothetical protein
VPADAGFDAQALGDARAALLEQGLLRIDARGNVQMAYAAYDLVLPSVFPEAVIVATISDRGAGDVPARIVCFSRNGDSVVVNWVDAQGDHHFHVYARQDARPCVLAHLLSACDLNVVAPDASQKAPGPREVERAAEQMKQAVALMATTGLGTPAQATRAAGWFVSGGRAWLMQTPERGTQGAPQPAALQDVARAVLGLAEQTLERG